MGEELADFSDDYAALEQQSVPTEPPLKAIRGLPLPREVKPESNIIQHLHNEISKAFDESKAAELATAYTKLIEHIKEVGVNNYAYTKGDPKSRVEARNTFYQWSNTFPQLTPEKAAVLLTTPDTIKTMTLDQTNRIHGSNIAYRSDPGVILDSRDAATRLVAFLEDFKFEYFEPSVSEQGIGSEQTSPHTVNVMIGRKRKPISLD